MNIALYFESKEVNRFFYFSLLQQGHNVEGFTEAPALIQFLESRECQLLVMDFDYAGGGGEDLLAKVRLVSEKIEIVLVTFLSNFLMGKILKKYRVFGVESKPISYPFLLEQIQFYIGLILKNPIRSMRKYPRFAIGKIHNIVKLVFSDLNVSYIGSVRDISLGGMGVELKKEANQYLVFSGKKLQGQVELGTLAFGFQGQIANFNGKKRLGIDFREINPHDLKKIKDFILEIMIEKETSKE